MPTPSQTPVIWTVIICTVLLAIIGAIAYANVDKEAPVVPTAQEIAALIVIPEVDTSTVDKLCKLTDGCEYFETDFYRLNIEDAEDAEDDFLEAMEEVTLIDEDYLEIDFFRIKDTQVRAYSEDDKDDGNWDVKVFAKVTYHDIDDDDKEYMYILIESTLDENEYNSLTVTEVSRSFEFN